jgi:hypothetical protein
VTQDKARLQIVIEAMNLASKELKTLEKDLGKVDKKSEKTGGALSKLGKMAGTAFLAIGGTYALRRLIGAATALADLGERAQRAEDALVAFTGSAWEAEQATKAVEAAAGGAISRLTATENAARLFGMGLAKTSEEAAELTKIAITLGKVTGRDATKAFEDFTLMLANRSILRLDTFALSAGKTRDIIADLKEEGYGLDEAFKMAVMDQARVKLAQLEEQGFQTASSLEIMRAETENWKLELAELSAQVLPDIVKGQAESMRTDRALIEQYGLGKTIMKTVFGGRKKLIEEYNQMLRIQNTEIAKGELLLQRYNQAQVENKDAMWDVVLTTEEANAELASLNQLINIGLTQGYEQATEKLAELNEEEENLLLQLEKFEGKDPEKLVGRWKKEYDDLQGKLEDVRGEIKRVQDAWSEQTKRMIFGLAQQALAVDGFTSEEMSALAKLAGPEGFGLVDQEGQEMIAMIGNAATEMALTGDQSDIFVAALQRQQEQLELDEDAARGYAGEINQIRKQGDLLHGSVYEATVIITTIGNIPRAKTGTGGPSWKDRAEAMRHKSKSGGQAGLDVLVAGAPADSAGFFAQGGERVIIQTPAQQKAMSTKALEDKIDKLGFKITGLVEEMINQMAIMRG